MKINWKVRFTNPVFIFQFVLALLAPSLAYVGLNYQDLTSWNVIGELLLVAITNPFVLALTVSSIYQTLNDPTTKGHSDSPRALTYKKVK